MPIIKNQEICDNSWCFVANDEPLPANGDVTVSLQRWQQDKPALLQRAGQVGIRLLPGDDLEVIADDIAKIALIELEFPHFADGRLFSNAHLLRSRHGYQGEIRAVGHYLTDQVFYLHRVGVNAFQFEKSEDIALALKALGDFSVKYQASIC